jgi:hypothetical protein
MPSKTDSGYRTLSTKIRRDPTFLDFNMLCKQEGKTHSAKIKELIEKENNKKKKPYFYAGNIRVVYNSALNNYTLKALLENGEEVILWDNLNESFVRSLKNEINSAIEMRNHFVHGLGDNNVAIPTEKIGDEE